jgi:LacI family transcriptional regulator
MSPRLIDIAKIAEVSPSAVSLALNNKTGVSSEVRQKIIDVAEKLGYRSVPAGHKTNENITIKLLKLAKNKRVIGALHDIFITEYLEGIEQAARKRNYKQEVSFFTRDAVQDIGDIKDGLSADGLLILGTELFAKEIDFFSGIPQPVVFIDTYMPFSIFDCVDIDNADGVFQSIRYLYNGGHRNIGLVRSSYETRNFKMREDGFRESMEYFSLPVQEKFIVSVDPTFEKSTEDMNRFLAKHSVLPTAFFCMNDIIAYGCMKALREHSYRIPEDVSVIGFDDLPSSAITEPPLTTVRVSTRQIGERALERLSDKINGLVQGNPEKILVSGTLIIRNSVRTI